MFFSPGGLLLVVGLDPVFPMLACGAILAAEFEPGDVGIAYLAVSQSPWA